jgi:transcriptional regulator with XRE-family HTH domain
VTSNQFRAALDRLHLTQEQAAKFLGRSTRSVWGYCNGEPIDRPIILLLAVMTERDISPEDLR